MWSKINTQCVLYGLQHLYLCELFGGIITSQTSSRMTPLFFSIDHGAIRDLNSVTTDTQLVGSRDVMRLTTTIGNVTIQVLPQGIRLRGILTKVLTQNLKPSWIEVRIPYVPIQPTRRSKDTYSSCRQWKRLQSLKYIIAFRLITVSYGLFFGCKQPILVIM